MASPSSTEKGQWVCGKPAWGLLMAPDVSMCQTQQSCGWNIAYKIGITCKHPRSRLAPGTTLSKDGHIRLNKHLLDQWRPSTRTVAETPGRHHARILTQTMRNHLRRFKLRTRLPYRPILNRQWRTARLHQGTVQRLSFLNLPHTGFP